MVSTLSLDHIDSLQFNSQNISEACAIILVTEKPIFIFLSMKVNLSKSCMGLYYDRMIGQTALMQHIRAKEHRNSTNTRMNYPKSVA